MTERHQHGEECKLARSRATGRLNVVAFARDVLGWDRPGRKGVKASLRRIIQSYLNWNRGLVLDPWLRYYPAIRILRRHQQGKETRVLDVGCGGGGLAHFWDRPIVGVDVQFTTSEIGSLPASLCPVRASATCLPFREGSFDVVVSMDMLEHLPSAERARGVGELFRVARSTVIVGCPFGDRSSAFDLEAFQEERRRGVDFVWREDHIRHGTPSTEVHSVILQAVSETRPGMRLEWFDHEGLTGLRLRWKLQFLVSKDSRVYGLVLGPLYWIHARLRTRNGYRRVYVGRA